LSFNGVVIFIPEVLSRHQSQDRTRDIPKGVITFLDFDFTADKISDDGPNLGLELE